MNLELLAGPEYKMAEIYATYVKSERSSPLSPQRDQNSAKFVVREIVVNKTVSPKASVVAS
jgi:hypothetical protein